MKKSIYHPIRVYFGVTVSHLIPLNPKDRVSDEDWEDEFIGGLRDDIEKNLTTEGFDVAYRKHRPVNSARRLFAVNFVVATLHKFAVKKTRNAAPNKPRATVRQFESAKKELSNKIRDALETHYVINDISYEYAAYREFIFLDHLIATLRIKHIITPEELDMAEGKIRGAIEAFETEIMEPFRDTGWSGWLKSTNRRPKDDIYEFELAVEAANSYSETEVCGPLVLLTKDMPAHEAKDLCIDTIDPAVGTAQTQEQLNGIIDTELFGHDIVEATVQWQDYNPNVHEICTELEM